MIKKGKISSLSTFFKIKSDKGCFIWISIKRFEYNLEYSMKSPIFINNVKIGQYVICINESSKHWHKVQDVRGVKVFHSKKLPSVTISI